MIVLPWPDRRLSPNARIHWRALAPVKKAAKETAYILTKQARARVEPGLIPMRVTFNAPDRRLRDDDNCIGAFKYYRDGIALALGVDDRAFRPSYHFGEPVKGGQVIVELVEDKGFRSFGEIAADVVADIASRMEEAA